MNLQGGLPHIYVDQDGVLAAFYPAMAAILGQPFNSLSPAERWGKLEKVPRLFRNLALCADALELWHGLEGRGERSILTAAPMPTGFLVTAPEDKLAWIRERISSSVKVEVAESGLAKAAWASPDAILIDDLQRNIDVWRAAGGIGILHTSASNTLATLDLLGFTRKSA